MNQVRSLEGLHKTLIAEFNRLEIFRHSLLSRPAELPSAACLRRIQNGGLERARHALGCRRRRRVGRVVLRVGAVNNPSQEPKVENTTCTVSLTVFKPTSQRDISAIPCGHICGWYLSKFAAFSPGIFQTNQISSCRECQRFHKLQLPRFQCCDCDCWAQRSRQPALQPVSSVGTCSHKKLCGVTHCCNYPIMNVKDSVFLRSGCC